MINEARFRLKKNGEPYSDCFCRHPELIENYEKAIADTTQTWDVHHRKEDFYSQKELKERGEYFDVPPEDLIFLTRFEHNKIDSMGKRVSEAKKGNKRPSPSEETKRKLSEALKGKLINRKDQSKKVLCVETGEIFESISDAHRKTGITLSSISSVCNGKLKTAGKFHWRYV